MNRKFLVKFHRFSSSPEKEIQREALVSSKILKHPFMIVQINGAIPPPYNTTIRRFFVYFGCFRLFLEWSVRGKSNE